MPTSLVGNRTSGELTRGDVGEKEIENGQKPLEKTVPIEGGNFLKGREDALSGLSPQAADELKAVSRLRLQSAGARLFLRGQQPLGVFFLNWGSAKLSVATARGRAVIVRIAKPGDILGLNAVISGRPYETTAEILTSSQVDYIEYADFHRLLERHESASQWVIRQLSVELTGAYRQMTRNQTEKNSRVKLARLFLEWSKTHALPTRDGAFFHVGLTHEEISELIGTTRETVTRLMSDFRNQGLIETQGKLIGLPDPSRLESLLSPDIEKSQPKS